VPDNAPALLTRQEVERRLHVSGRTIYRLIEAGKLATHKVGRDYRFEIADVEAYLASTRMGCH
jgi:excisionase family DNA binding protein